MFGSRVMRRLFAFAFVWLVVSAEAIAISKQTLAISSASTRSIPDFSAQRAYKLLLGGLLFAVATSAAFPIAKLFPTIASTTSMTACECTPTGMSGLAQTNFKGCAEHIPGKPKFCYVIGGNGCTASDIKISTKFAKYGAAYRPCEVVETKDVAIDIIWSFFQRHGMLLVTTLIAILTLAPIGMVQTDLLRKQFVQNAPDDPHLSALMSSEWKCNTGTTCSSFDSFVTTAPKLTACANRFARVNDATTRFEQDDFSPNQFILEFDCHKECTTSCAQPTTWTPVLLVGTVRVPEGASIVVSVADQFGVYRSDLRVRISSTKVFVGDLDVTGKTELFSPIDKSGKFQITVPVHPQVNRPMVQIEVTARSQNRRRYEIYGKGSFRGSNMME